MAISKTHVLETTGSGQYASITDASQTGLDVTGSLSVLFWLKMSASASPANNARYTFVSKYDATNAGYEVNWFNSGGTFVLEVRIRQSAATQDVKTFAFSTNGLLAGKWIHVAVVADYSGGPLSLNLYSNGVNRTGAQSGTTTSIGNSTVAFAVGARSDGSSTFATGLISDVRIEAAALTQDQIIAIMRYGGNLSSTKGQWRFNNNYTDAGPSNNILTPTGSPSFNTTDLPFTKYGRTTRFFVGPGDGNVSVVGGVGWDATHDATSGTAADASSNTLKVESSRSTSFRTIRRAFLPFNTAGLDGDLQVVGATLGLSLTSTSENGTGNSLVLVQTSQPDPTTLAVADFDNCGSVNSPTEGATRYAVGSIVAAQNTHSLIELNSTGITWVNLSGYTLLGLRMPKDADDVDYVSSVNDTVLIKTSEATGTVEDPFLDVVDDDTFYGGSTDDGGTGGGAGDFGGIDLGGGSGSGPGIYTPPVGGGIGGSGQAGASNTNTVALAGIFFVE